MLLHRMLQIYLNKHFLGFSQCLQAGNKYTASHCSPPLWAKMVKREKWLAVFKGCSAG